jgi:hypothetical protein
MPGGAEFELHLDHLQHALNPLVRRKRLVSTSSSMIWGRRATYAGSAPSVADTAGRLAACISVGLEAG